MKTALIIPSYNQSKYLPRIFKAIELQSIKPSVIYLMVDRPEDDETIEQYLKQISKLNLNIVIKYVNKIPKNIEFRSTNNPFLTPYIRNSGIANALSEGCDNFIFIDGDCIPQKNLIQSHLKKLNHHIPVLSVGRRREAIYKWQDRREHVPELLNLNLFREKGTLINNPQLLKQSLIVWSCNMAMNLPAIKLIKKFNKKYYFRDEVFSSEFVGKWGGEDAFLGIQSHYCRVFITTIGEKSSGIEHIDHPRPPEKYNLEHMKFLNNEMEKLSKKIMLNPMEIDFFVT